jgi:hypothetical protein
MNDWLISLVAFWLPLALLPMVAAIPIVIIGNERDAHGCFVSAGYHWCEYTEACQRSWEVPCLQKA